MERESRPYLGLGLLVRALEASIDPVEIDDIQGNIVYINEAWAQLFQRESRQVIGAKWDSLEIEGFDYDNLRLIWNQAVADGSSGGITSLNTLAVRPQPVSYSRTLYRNVEGSPAAVITIYRPLSQEVRQLRHQLRNVFSAIIGNVELLTTMSIEDQAVLNRISNIRTASNNGMSLLEGLAVDN